MAAAADVMWPRKKLLLAFVFAIALAAVVWFAARHSAPAALVSFTVLGYTNVSITKPDAVRKGDWIRAEVEMKNESAVAVYYQDYWERENFGSGFAQTATGWISVFVEKHLGEFSSILRPGSNFTAFVWLPAGTVTWQCGLPVQGLSVRERALRKLVESGWFLNNRLRPLLNWALKLLPDKRRPMVRLKSGLFAVGAASNGPPQFKPRQSAGAEPGR